jgi:hypothetical protein
MSSNRLRLYPNLQQEMAPILLGNKQRAMLSNSKAISVGGLPGIAKA